MPSSLTVSEVAREQIDSASTAKAPPWTIPCGWRMPSPTAIRPRARSVPSSRYSTPTSSLRPSPRLSRSPIAGAYPAVRHRPQPDAQEKEVADQTRAECEPELARDRDHCPGGEQPGEAPPRRGPKQRPAPLAQIERQRGAAR